MMMLTGTEDIVTTSKNMSPSPSISPSLYPPRPPPLPLSLPPSLLFISSPLLLPYPILFWCLFSNRKFDVYTVLYLIYFIMFFLTYSCLCGTLFIQYNFIHEIILSLKFILHRKVSNENIEVQVYLLNVLWCIKNTLFLPEFKILIMII